jgi:signal transduction histidine kinase
MSACVSTAGASPGLDPGAQDPEALIALLEAELATTNHEVMVLILELEQRVDEAVAELCRVSQDLLRENSERQRADEEVRSLNQELARRAELLEAAHKELETFSYSVSHDLRAPLRHILGFATMLREEAGEALGEKPSEHLNKLTESATRMSNLTDGATGLAVKRGSGNL